MKDFKGTRQIDFNILPQDWIDEMYEHIFESMENNFSKKDFYNSGGFRLNATSPELKIKFHFYYFLVSIDEILRNIILVASDLKTLIIYPHYYQGSTYERFYLILRTFFYEFYRIKEKHKDFLFALEKEKYIEKGRIKDINILFHSLFKETLDLRNSLVHHNVVWTENNTELAYLYMCIETDHRLFKESTGEEVTFESILPELCDYYFNIFIGQSVKVKGYIETLTKELIKLKPA
jgi:hypothetical protein